MISWIVSIFGISKVCRLDAKKLTWGAFKTSLLLKSADEMNPTRAISVTNDWYSLLSKRLDILTLGSSSLVSFALIWACIRGAVCVQLCIKFSTDCVTSPQHPFLPRPRPFPAASGSRTHLLRRPSPRFLSASASESFAASSSPLPLMSVHICL